MFECFFSRSSCLFSLALKFCMSGIKCVRFHHWNIFHEFTVQHFSPFEEKVGKVSSCFEKILNFSANNFPLLSEKQKTFQCCSSLLSLFFFVSFPRSVSFHRSTQKTSLSPLKFHQSHIYKKKYISIVESWILVLYRIHNWFNILCSIYT